PDAGGDVDKRPWRLVSAPGEYGLSAALPAAEGGEQRVPGRGRDRRRGQLACEADGGAHLLDVRVAARAERQVAFEALALGRRQAVFEVVGDQLHQLLAAQVGGRAHLLEVLLADRAARQVRLERLALRRGQRPRQVAQDARVERLAGPFV